jgi:predicted lipoprotein with Yx(FWY)xxD motif
MKRAFLLFTALVATAAAQANPTIETNGVLTSRDGRTLYTFDKDSESKSHCNGGCLAAWPAFTVGNASFADGNFSVIARDDGTQQWAFQGKPLYFYGGDVKPGEVNGDSKGGVWHALRTEAKKAVRNDSSSFSTGYSYSY